MPRLSAKFILTLSLCLSGAMLTGCSQAENQTDRQAADPSVTAPAPADVPGLRLCTDPRPEICTQEYAPVCGVHEDGTRSTYSNGCVACSNAEVVGSLPGECGASGEGL